MVKQCIQSGLEDVVNTNNADETLHFHEKSLSNKQCEQQRALGTDDVTGADDAQIQRNVTTAISKDSFALRR
jgi:hypothetical protein